MDIAVGLYLDDMGIEVSHPSVRAASTSTCEPIWLSASGKPQQSYFHQDSSSEESSDLTAITAYRHRQIREKESMLTDLQRLRVHHPEKYAELFPKAAQSNGRKEVYRNLCVDVQRDRQSLGDESDDS